MAFFADALGEGRAHVHADRGQSCGALGTEFVEELVQGLAVFALGSPDDLLSLAFILAGSPDLLTLAFSRDSEAAVLHASRCR
ncbi:hypothetical protein ACWD7F_37030, partial [Streptomyces sp. NPDC005122]